jgi:hypothetical protein
MDTVTKHDLSQKLLRCEVVNTAQHRSHRFVELEQFKLWSYMMSHKHGLQIGEISLWLWVGEEDFLARQEIYSRAPEILSVNRLAVFLFDEENGFSHVIYRYVHENETADVSKILQNHLSPELIAANNCELTVQKGYCLKNSSKSLENLVLGLSGKEE